MWKQTRVWDQALSKAEFVLYWNVPHHLPDLVKLSIGEKFSDAASAMAEQAIDVQKEVRTRLEKFNEGTRPQLIKGEKKSLKGIW